MQIGKEEMNCSLFADGMTVYEENPKESTNVKNKLLELISKLNNYAQNNINN